MTTAIKRSLNQRLNDVQDGISRRSVSKAFDAILTEVDSRSVQVKMENVSVGKSVYVCSPYTGNISTIYAVLGATTVGPTPDVFSFGVNGVSLSGNTLTISTGTTAATGSSVSPTANVAITAGQVIRLSGNGGSTGPAMDAIFTVVVGMA